METGQFLGWTCHMWLRELSLSTVSYLDSNPQVITQNEGHYRIFRPDLVDRLLYYSARKHPRDLVAGHPL